MFNEQILGLAPVLVIFYNRPDNLLKVIEVLKEEKVREIYFAGDGPRNSEDQEDVQACRRLILESFPGISAERLRFSEKNLGCRIAVSCAIDWFFSRVNQGIILEDDCLPGANFFQVLSDSLNKYSSDKRIFSINATSPVLSKTSNVKTYLSVYPQIWGWATWSDRWELYKREFADADGVIENVINNNFQTWNSIDRMNFRIVWKSILKQAGAGKIDTWDYSMLATMWRNNMVAVQPSGNYVVNIGFSPSATHTTKVPKWAPRNYQGNGSAILSEPSTNPGLDLALSKIVYRCTFLEIAKRIIKYFAWTPRKLS